MLEPTALYGGNADYLDALYEQYLRDPASVESQWRQYFDALGTASKPERPHGPVRAAIADRAAHVGTGSTTALGADARQAAVSRLIQVWTNRGHLVASIDPLALTARARPSVLDLSYFGLAPAD